MSDPYLGEIRLFAFDFNPQGWALCQGQLLPIQQNQALFSLLGTFYGGNGQTTFALPDLRARAPMHVGGTTVQGQVGGESAHTLTVNEMPAHTHALQARSFVPPTSLGGSPAGTLWARSSQTAYGPAPNAPVTMAAGAISSAGGGQAHDNLPPYLVMSFAIALVGIYPPRN